MISLGAGVQSTTMALMAAHGEIDPMPSCAIFSDTGWEPKHVYAHLDWLCSPNVLPFQVEIVSRGNIRTDITTILSGQKSAGRRATAPFFTKGRDGLAAPLRRQCTGHYKIEPIEKRLKHKLGIKPRVRQPTEPMVEVWMGISTDEIYRVKPAQLPWIKRRWPLIEKRMSRQDCLNWMERHGYPRPPKSSCIGCPYHNDAYWRDMKDNSPDEWRDAVEIDKAVRAGFARIGTGGRTNTGALYLHRSLKPLDQVDLSTPEDHGQLNLFNNECEGMCGV
ncbi:MAG TPA: hypothetical protein VKB34_11765 [Povalibacter sp.]|nr:hypothetical protein [Povalibacter sp.]